MTRNTATRRERRRFPGITGLLTDPASVLARSVWAGWGRSATEVPSDDLAETAWAAWRRSTWALVRKGWVTAARGWASHLPG